ncbi:MAG: T9SS type A sorting domain-containing protein [Ignavibacteriales bacterium]|nr:T9SS type A sorting domain-containing protein [Ignavibacteriales bacterium]
MTRNYIGSINKSDGGLAPWNPNASHSVNAIAIDYDHSRILVGGNFFDIAGEAIHGFAALSDPSDPALPVELVSFSAKYLSNAVQLSWQTATEVDNYGFEVERKTTTTDWQKISFIEGHGTSNSPKYYNFSDPVSSTGKISYRLKQLDNDGKFEYSNIVEIDTKIPSAFALEQNYPNPFNPETVIRFNLPQAGSVSLKLYNMQGEEVAILQSGAMDAGSHSITLDATKYGLTSGVYVYRLSSIDVTGKSFTASRKLVLMK